MLVIYFSAKHHTQKIAHKIAQLINANIFEIQAIQPYTPDDLYYQNPSCRANKEQRSANIRVDFVQLPDIQKEQIIFLGYPIWWDSAPKIIWNIVEQLDLKGKTVIPFCTSGGSSIYTSEKELHQLNPSAHWQKGFRVDMSVSNQQLQTFINHALKE